MLPPHLRKFSDFYEKYGLGAVKNFWLLACLIPLAQTVNLNKLKDYVGGVLGTQVVKPPSHYCRLVRFFEDWGSNEPFFEDIVQMNLRLLKKLGCKTLVMDGTSWKIGETAVHYLVLSVLVGTVAVPIYWVQLEKAGSSSQTERKAMFDKALSLFDLSGMTLLADREYIGCEWFKYLKANKIHFVIRMRMGDYEADVNAAAGNSYYKMYEKCAAKNKIINKQVWIGEDAYTIVMMPNPKANATEPVFIFLTTLPMQKKLRSLTSNAGRLSVFFATLKPMDIILKILTCGIKVRICYSLPSLLLHTFWLLERDGVGESKSL